MKHHLVTTRVHGGLTYSATVSPNTKGRVVNKVNGLTYWVFGFDTGHVMDVAPGARFPLMVSGREYRDMDYVRKQIEVLIEDLKM